MTKFLQILAAAVSLSCVMALFYWAVTLATLDTSKVPVIRKAQGPARIAPENPGGAATNHLGYAVNSVQANGDAEAPAETVRLAPQPVGLSVEDLAGLEVQEAVLIREAIEQEATNQEAASQGITDQGTIVTATTGTVATKDAAPKLREVKLAPLETTDDLAAKEALAEALAIARAAAENTLKPATSSSVQSATSDLGQDPAHPRIKPQLRPANIEIALASSKPAKPKAQTPAKPYVTEVALGTVMVQLGAFDSEKIVTREWSRLRSKHDELLGDKKLYVQKTQKGDKTYYRLRALGFAKASEAKNLCSALDNQGTACIPVVAR